MPAGGGNGAGNRARRAAAAGFLALAPDALDPLGGYPGTDDEGRTLQATRSGAEMLEDFIAAVKLMQAHPDCNGKVGSQDAACQQLLRRQARGAPLKRTRRGL